MLSDKNTSHLLLGSNLGNREKFISDALLLIEEQVGEILLTSAIYETAAWGNTDQPNFLNLAIVVQTALSPLQLLEAVLAIEQRLGRIREERWGARVIDIDIIFYGNEIIDVPQKLQIPHPELQNRRFVLLPLNEITPNFVHPILGQNISKLLVNLTDELTVFKK
jgi:2-amino-4-hydroxy-6-hydroxymethyldihydropteridine diphosphokinase